MIAVGDVSGDDREDLVVCIEDVRRGGCEPGLYIFDGGLNSDDFSDYSYHIFPPYHDDGPVENTKFCNYVKIGDVTGDGKDDIIVNRLGGQPVVYVLYDLDDERSVHPDSCAIDWLGDYEDIYECSYKYDIVDTSGGALNIVAGIGDVDEDGINELMIGTDMFSSKGSYYPHALLVFKGPINSDLVFNDYSTGYYLPIEHTENCIRPPSAVVYTNPDDDRYLVISEVVYATDAGGLVGAVYFARDIDLTDHSLHDLSVNGYQTGIGSDPGTYYGFSLDVKDDLLAISAPGADQVDVGQFRATDGLYARVATMHACQFNDGCLGHSIALDRVSEHVLYATDPEHNELQVSNLVLSQEPVLSEIQLSVQGESEHVIRQVVPTSRLGIIYVLAKGSGKVYLLDTKLCRTNRPPIIHNIRLTDSLGNAPAWEGLPLLLTVNVSDPDWYDNELNITAWVCSGGDVTTCVYPGDYNVSVTCVQDVNCSNLSIDIVPAGITSQGQSWTARARVKDSCSYGYPNPAASGVLEIIQAAQQPITSCTMIDTPGDYFLATDLYPTKDNLTFFEYNGVFPPQNPLNYYYDCCIVINSSYVNLNLNGKTISGINVSRDPPRHVFPAAQAAVAGICILNNPTDRNTNINIYNGTIKDWFNSTFPGFDSGIVGYIIDDLTIANIVFETPNQANIGAIVSGTSDYLCNGIKITDNQFIGYNGLGGSGVRLGYTNASNISDNSFTSCYSGILSEYNTNLSITGNTIDNVTLGIIDSAGADNSISFNRISDISGINPFGIEITDPVSSIHVIDNIISNPTNMINSRGIQIHKDIDAPVAVNLTGNTITGLYDGIDLLYSSANDVLVNNLVCDSYHFDILASTYNYGYGGMSADLGINNTCSVVNGWADTGVSGSGCTYECPVCECPSAPPGTVITKIYDTGGTSTSPAAPSILPTYHITSPGYYCLCGDRYTQGNNIIISDTEGVTLDCNGFVVGHELGSTYTHGIKISDTNNVNIKNCNIAYITGLPWEDYGYSLLLTGSSDNITVQDSNFTYDVKIENSGDNLFERVRFENPDRKLSFSGEGRSLVKDSTINLLRLLIHEGNVDLNNVSLDIADFILLEKTSQTNFSGSTSLYSGDIKIISNNNNRLMINNLKNESSINNEVTSDTSFGIIFDNLILEHPEINPFVLEVYDGFTEVNESELKVIRQQGNSKLYLLNSNITDQIKLYETAELLSQGSRVNEFHLKDGDDIKYIGPMQWEGNITADSRVNRFMVGRLRFVYSPDREHAVRCGVVEITDSSGGTHKCVLSPENHGWLYIDEDYLNIDGDVSLNYTYRIKFPNDGVNKLDGTGIYMTLDECKDDLEYFGVIDSSTPPCPELQPDVYSDIGNITDPCPFQTKPDGSNYLCYGTITDWAKDWDHNASTPDDGWFSKNGLPIPSHYG